ncbi:MAG TPA: AraC family transcriptional regulator [Streptosporangiaceae bacterium]|jgi:AraC-like DNA-binding protein
MDALTAVLAVAGVRGTVAATLDAAEPWGLALDAVPGAAFHAVTEGLAWLCIPGRPDTRLMPGDVVLLPTGIGHVLASAPDADSVPFDHVAAEQAMAVGQDLRLGAGPRQTRILCASYHQNPAATVPLLTLLPDVLHVPARQAGAALDATLRLLACEISRSQPGGPAVLDRIVDILLVQLLRTWLEVAPAPDRAASWLSALTDPVAGPALAVLHTQPSRDWTVPSLAAAIGVSRATLARRFPAQVGCTPAAYLTRWRMDLAAVRLRDTDDTVGAIARSLGYTSEYAFNRAFTRHRHIPPGRYRTRSRAGKDGPSAP